MKTVLLLRHAKSSWDNPAQADHDRPLNARGLRAAPRMGQLIADEGLRPQLIVSSTAERARTTAAMVAEECGYEGDVRLTDELYHASPQDCLRVLGGLPDDLESVLLVGHNPGLSELVLELSGQRIDMPTAGLVLLQSPRTSWSEFERDPCCDLVSFWRPKGLS